MLRTCRPGIHFRGISRFVYLTAMTKADSNVGFLRPYIPLIRNCDTEPEYRIDHRCPHMAHFQYDSECYIPPEPPRVSWRVFYL